MSESHKAVLMRIKYVKLPYYWNKDMLLYRGWADIGSSARRGAGFPSYESRFRGGLFLLGVLLGKQAQRKSLNGS
jgi:hypothetical protein